MRQDVGEERGSRAHGIGQHQHGAEVEGVGTFCASPDLAAATTDHGPGSQAVISLGRVLAVGAGLTLYAAGVAVLGASAEVPPDELDDAFFSASLARAGAT